MIVLLLCVVNDLEVEANADGDDGDHRNDDNDTNYLKPCICDIFDGGENLPKYLPML